MTISCCTDGIRLVATPTAISCASLFVMSTLTRWGTRSTISDAVLVVEELVTNAVKATGMLDERVHWTEITRLNFITLHLLGREDSIRMEVWDSSPNLPLLPDNAGSPVKRGCYVTAGGKVVWAELSLLPQRRKTSACPLPPPEQFEQDPYLLRRVLNGLNKI